MNTRSLLRSLALVALAVAGACGDSSSESFDMGPSPDLRKVYDLTGMRSTIGDACKPSEKGSVTNCSSEDSFCYSDGRHGFAGGVCTQDCTNAACPDDAVCVRLAEGFDRCLAACNSDADCRSPDYVCSDFQACMPKLGFYVGQGVRPGSNDGMACGAAPTAESPFEKAIQVSALNGSQVSIAVDEASGHVLMVWQDLFAGAQIAYATSEDRGVTFGAPTLLPVDNTVDDNALQADPVAAVDSSGAFYIAWTGSGNVADKVYVARSTDGGETFAQLAIASPADESAADTLYKPSIAIATDDTVYVSWTTALTGNPVVRVTRSTDQGATFAAPITVTEDGADHQNARIAVSHTDGSVYVAWLEVGGNTFGDAKNKIAMQRLSPDLTLDGGRVQMSPPTDFPTLDVPSIAVDGTKVYVAYTSGKPDGAWDIRVAASLDRGATVKPSVKVNGDASCATHFHPAIAVDGAGLVHVVYDDNRAGDDKGALNHAVSTGGGELSFEEQSVTFDASFPFTTESGGYDWLGDYVGLVAAGNHVYVGWADTRTNDTAQVFFTRSGF